MLSLIYNKKGIAIYKELFATLNIGMPNKDTMLFLSCFGHIWQPNLFIRGFQLIQIKYLSIE